MGDEMGNASALRALLLGVSVAVLSLLIIGSIGGAAGDAPSVPGKASLLAAEPEGTAIAMAGSVALLAGMPGTYSDTLTTATPDPDGDPPPELGAIDLGLQLYHTGCCSPSAPCTLTGHVRLDNSLVFTAEHTIDLPDPTPDLDVGPEIYGTYDGSAITLESERTSVSTAGRDLDRQFALTGALVGEGVKRLEGEYRETIWGYGLQPLTVIGQASLLSPLRLSGDCNDDGFVDAGDVTALILEIFDADGWDPLDAPQSDFDGTAVGCNSNADSIVDAADISCLMWLIFGGPCSCG
jgi:hypothetical protein